MSEESTGEPLNDPAPANGHTAAKPLEYRRPTAAPPSDAYEVIFPSRLRDLYAPIALVVIAWLGAVALAATFGGGTIISSAAFVTAYLVVKLVIFLLAVPLLVVLGISFGPLASASIKLCAIALLPDVVMAASIVAGGTCFGLLVGVIAGFATCWMLFQRLFELDVSESALCAAVYAGIALGLMFLWWRLMGFLLSIAPA